MIQLTVRKKMTTLTLNHNPLGAVDVLYDEILGR